MQSISVVVICKNEADIISTLLQSLQGVTDDIIVYDTGSDDDTVAVARQFPVKVHLGEWEGYGKTKNRAIALARYDWILSLDADESVGEDLKKELLNLALDNENVIYKIRFKNFFGDKWLKHGDWGNDWHLRLFNRKQFFWDNALVHEKLIINKDARIIKLGGSILHHTARDISKYESKLMRYAELNANNYFVQGKKAGPFKKYVSSSFSFIQNYFFKAGFLDGKAGYRCSKLLAEYTFNKYKKLDAMKRSAKELKKS